MSSFNRAFATETWTLYGVSLLVVFLRFWARIRKLGITKLQADDYLMVHATLWYTVLVVAVNKTIFGGGSNFMTAEEEAALTPASIRERTKGSKWVVVSEQAMILTIWSFKLCMLFIYGRLTEGLKQRKLITLLFIWVACGFVGTELCLFLACRPFAQYWAVPPADRQCATYQHYEITQSIFNTSSDIMMLLIGIPLLLSVRLPLQQKAVLLIVFGMGIFVIVAAILTKIYCLVPGLISYVYLKWYFREASVSLYVTNLPALWSLVRDMFPQLKSWGFETKKSSGSGRHWPVSREERRKHRNLKSFPMQTFSRLGSKGGNMQQSVSQSQERIHEAEGFQGHPNGKPQPLEIKRDVTFTVEKGTVDKDIEAGDPGYFETQHGGQTRCTASR